MAERVILRGDFHPLFVPPALYEDALRFGLGVAHIRPNHFLKTENDPMNITINIREIANGFLVETAAQVTTAPEYAALFRPIDGPLHYATLMDVRQALPDILTKAVAREEEQRAREESQRWEPQHAPSVRVDPEETTREAFDRVSQRLKPGFVIGGEASDAAAASLQAGMEPETDVAWELVDWAATHIREDVEYHGGPLAIAMVLISPDEPGGVSTVRVWSPRDRTIGSRICAVASTMLQARGEQLLREA